MTSDRKGDTEEDYIQSEEGQERVLSTVTWTKVQESICAGRLTKIILPVGSLEQHGPHLPLATDALLADYVAHAVNEKCSTTYLMPTIYVGCSGEHMGFPGTVSVQVDTMSNMLFDISRSLLESSKLTNLVIINGHGGNRAVIDMTIRKIKDAIPEMNVCSFTIVDIAKKKFEEIRRSDRRFVGHADELETSMMLAIDPELVDMSKAVNEGPSIPDALSFEPDDLAKVSFGWNAKDLTESGVIGSPLFAEASKGRILLDFVTKVIAETINKL